MSGSSTITYLLITQVLSDSRPPVLNHHVALLLRETEGCEQFGEEGSPKTVRKVK